MFTGKNIKLHTLLLVTAWLCLSIGPAKAFWPFGTKKVVKTQNQLKHEASSYTQKVMAAFDDYKGEIRNGIVLRSKLVDMNQKADLLALPTSQKALDQRIKTINSLQTFTYNVSPLDIKGQGMIDQISSTALAGKLGNLKTPIHAPTLVENLQEIFKSTTANNAFDAQTFDTFDAIDTPKETLGKKDVLFNLQQGLLQISYKVHNGLLDEYKIIFQPNDAKANDYTGTWVYEWIMKVAPYKKQNEKDYSYKIKKITLSLGGTEKRGDNFKQTLTTFEDVVTPWGFVWSTATGKDTIYLKKDGAYIQKYQNLPSWLKLMKYKADLQKRRISYYLTLPWNRTPKKLGW